jgi:DNA mismatch repair protein MutS
MDTEQIDTEQMDTEQIDTEQINTYFCLKEAGHPLMQKQCFFITNNCLLQRGQVLFLTGSNAGGKTTYLRMVGQLVVLSQVGVMIPAKEFSFSLRDALFVRMGSGDNPAENLSTFAVEIIELQHIIQYANEKSLVLIDEIGRGTSPIEGWALCRSVLIELIDTIGAVTLLTSHFHNLLKNLPLECMAKISTQMIHGALDEKTGLWNSFYKLKEGVADQSYGLDLAYKLKLSSRVVHRAMSLTKIADQ